MTNYKVRPDGLNPPESDWPALDAGFDERTPGMWKPADNLLKSANFPPRHIGIHVSITAGFIAATRVRVPANTVITNLHAYVHAAGSGLSYAAAAVYEADGSQSGVTASQATAWASAGHKVMALATPIPARPSARWVWVAFAESGTTLAALGCASGYLAANAGGVSPVVAGAIAGATPLPASLTLTSLGNWYEVWAGIS